MFFNKVIKIKVFCLWKNILENKKVKNKILDNINSMKKDLIGINSAKS